MRHKTYNGNFFYYIIYLYIAYFIKYNYIHNINILIYNNIDI
jgi:hypothetical protein